MDKYIQQRIQKIWDQTLKKQRTCMYSGCSNQAIKSHVLQKNGILRQISIDNHLIELDRPNIIKLNQGAGIVRFKKVGLNNSYTFTGFCNYHDSSIFNPIENSESIDLSSSMSQALFSYRGLCQEIRRKMDAKEHESQAVMLKPREIRHLSMAFIDGLESGIVNLTYFKEQFEKSIRDNDFSTFTFKTLKIPRIELCISTPLNIHKPEHITEDYEKWKSKKPEVYTTSFLNVLPIKEESFIVVGYHNDFPCEWTKHFIKRIENANRQSILKEISDLLVLRLEFWVMSPALFSLIPQNKHEEFNKVFMGNVFSHDENLQTELNLFDGL